MEIPVPGPSSARPSLPPDTGRGPDPGPRPATSAAARAQTEELVGAVWRPLRAYPCPHAIDQPTHREGRRERPQVEHVEQHDEREHGQPRNEGLHGPGRYTVNVSSGRT